MMPIAVRGLLAARWTGGDRHPSYRATFEGAPEVDIEVLGQQVPERGVRGSVGVEYRASPNMVWNLGLSAETGAGDASNAAATGGLRITF